MAHSVPRESAPIGVLGVYEDDADDEVYGLYIELGGGRVLVDIREDKLKAQREERALYLAARTAQLEASLAAFVSAHSEFASRQLATIGLHSKSIEQGEVFWEPTGYTLLKDLEFVLE